MKTRKGEGQTRRVSRRRFLEIGALAAGAVSLRSGLLPSLGGAAEGAGQLLLFVYFEGGWDQLLAFDPRPNDHPDYQRPKPNVNPATGILPAYEDVVDPDIRALLAANPSGVQTRGNLAFGPAVPPSLRDRWEDLCILRGLQMDTLSHQVGRRYLLTGKFPRGQVANGSSLNTVVAGLQNSTLEIPNLAISTEGYNEGWPAAMSPLYARGPADIMNVLRPLGPPLRDASQSALDLYELEPTTCQGHQHDGQGLVSMFRESRAKARTMTASDLSAYFNFALNPQPDGTLNPAPEVAPLLRFFDINTYADLSLPKGRAALAAQALARNVCQAVSVQLARDLDTHDDWGLTHGATLREGLDALGRLILWLRGRPYLGNEADSVWNHTTLLAYSEFSRTPLINGRAGRDHHQTSSCLVAGPGLRGNKLIGGTTAPGEPDRGMPSQRVNLQTGAVDPAGVLIKPQDVHATVLRSMGLGYGHLSNQSPRIIPAMLRG